MITQFTEMSDKQIAVTLYYILLQEIRLEVEWYEMWASAMKRQIDTLYYADFTAEDEE